MFWLGLSSLRGEPFWCKDLFWLVLAESRFVALKSISQLCNMCFLEPSRCSLIAGFSRWVFTVASVDWSMCRTKLLIYLHPRFFSSLCLFFLCKRAWWLMRRTVTQEVVRSEDIRACVNDCRFCWEMLDFLGLSSGLKPSPRVDICTYFYKLLNRQTRDGSFCWKCDVKAGGSKNNESNPCPYCDERCSF